MHPALTLSDMDAIVAGRAHSGFQAALSARMGFSETQISFTEDHEPIPPRWRRHSTVRVLRSGPAAAFFSSPLEQVSLPAPRCIECRRDGVTSAVDSFAAPGVDQPSRTSRCGAPSLVEFRRHDVISQVVTVSDVLRRRGDHLSGEV